MKNLTERLAEAVRYFWSTRERQDGKQGRKSGQRDQGSRSAVTGGKQLDGFAQLISDLLIEAGLPDHAIHGKTGRVTLPGYFRPTKEWDLLVVVDDKLLATIEFKSHVGPSFGNNFNNRTEEALGSATDILAAYREGLFKNSIRPWLGYFMLLEDAKGSRSPVRVDEPHFAVFEEFRNASYQRRYELFCERLVRERLYDAACLLTSSREGGLKGECHEPSAELSFRNFVASLTGRAIAYAKLRE